MSARVAVRRQSVFAFSHQRDGIAEESRGRIAWTRGVATGEECLS